MTELLLQALPWSLSGTDRDQKVYLAALALLLVGTVLASVALFVRRIEVGASAVAGAGVAAWLLSNRPAEGGTLLVVLPGNGLTTADLAAVPAVVLLVGLAWRRAVRH